MFYFDFDVANYADYTNCAGKSAEFVVNNFNLLSISCCQSLANNLIILFMWLDNNYMKVNPGKSHLLLSGNSRATATIDNSYIELADRKMNEYYLVV